MSNKEIVNNPFYVDEPKEADESNLHLDIETKKGNFKDYEEERMVINGIKMPVLPSDISFYSTNAVTQDAYIRAPGAFTFRSKHSRSVLNMIVSIPVLELATISNYSPREQEMAKKGIDLITSLDAYPFCFIQSHRVKSYLGSHNFENETNDPDQGGRKTDKGIMMFGVQKITISQDARVPGILVLEVDLLYNNHRTITPEIEIGWDRDFVTPEQDYAVTTSIDQYSKTRVKNNNIPGIINKTPDDDTTLNFDIDVEGEGGGFNQLVSALSAVPKARADILLNSTSSTMATDNFKSLDLLSQVRIRVPQFINLHELGIKLSSIANPDKSVYTIDDLDGNINNIPNVAAQHMTFIRLPSKISSPNFYVNLKTGKYSSVENEEADPEDIAESKANAYELYAVVWTEDKFAYTENLNPIQNIVATKERAFASHFIGSYQHPFLQYMGRYPATLTITSAFKGSEYTERTAPPYLFKMMLGAIDSNAVNYPQGNAFNYVKVEAYGNTLLGVEHFMPKDSQIIASASNSDMEIFTCTFIENSMDKMLDSAKIRIGKKIIIPESLDASSELISSYISNMKSYITSGKSLSQEEQNYHNALLDQMIYLVNVLTGKVEGMDQFGAMNQVEVPIPVQQTTAPTETGNTSTTASSSSGGVEVSKEALAVGILHFRYNDASNLVASGYGSGDKFKIHPDAKGPLTEMVNAAKKAGVTLTPGSIFRSTQRQGEIVASKKKQGQSDKNIYRMSSHPGYSEHHTGLAVDFSPISNSFSGTPGYKWLLANAKTYGFEQTFTSSYSAYSGVSEESWHWRYVGKNGELKHIFAASDSRPSKDELKKKYNV